MEIILGIIGVVGVPLALIGIGIGLAVGSAPTRGEFNFARMCFVVSAIIMAASVFLTLWNYPEGATEVRIAVAAVFGALIFGGLAASLDWLNHKQYPPKQDSPPEIQKFSWIWEPLTTDQIEAISAELKDKPTAKISITFNPRTAGQLAASFTQIFERAGWTSQGAASPLTILAGGMTGLGFYPNSETGRLLQSSISAHTKLRINFVQVQRALDGQTLLLGAKPPPDPLPAGLKAELNEIGKKLKEFGSNILTFAADRERENARAKAPLVPRSQESALAEHQRASAFSQETEMLLEQKFPQSSFLLGQLEILGIEMPFQVYTAKTRPARVGKWYAMIGSFLRYYGANATRALK